MFSDQAIKSADKDLFDRKNFSQRIAQIIARRTEKESIVIGIHAPWGEGKTSVLNMIVEELDEHIEKKNRKFLDGHLVLLKFNPWRFSDENQLLISFYTALGEALEKSIKNSKKKIGEKIKKYAWMTSPIEVVKFSLGGVIDANFDAKQTIEKIGEELSKTSIEELKSEIEKILNEENRKVVVVMDDIDRLDKEEIQSIFRLVKLSADFSNTIYILSFDIERVSEALKEKYGSKEAGKSFLEKIIQLSLPLPPLTSNKLIKLTFDEINKLLGDNLINIPQNADEEWSYFFKTTFGHYLKSPRLVKKYINNLWFSMPQTKDELNILDLQTIEAVHTFFPDLYETIRDNKNVFLLEPSNAWRREDEEKEHVEELKRIIEKVPEREKKIIKKIIQEMFPRTSKAFSNNHYGTDWYELWTKEKRIASPDYFQRYFNFGVSSDDISDIEFERFIYNLTSQTEEQNSNAIKQLISNNREELFLQKASLFTDSLEEELEEGLAKTRAVKLAKAIAVSGDYFPKGSMDAMMLNLTPFSHAARLLRHLVETVPESNRLMLSTQLVDLASPLDFACEFFRFAKSIGQDKNAERGELNKLGKAMVQELVKRIEIEAEEENLEKRYPKSSTSIYREWWYENKESLVNHLKKRFENNPKEAESFIISFYKQSWVVNGTALLFGFDFIISEVEKLYPDMKILALENHTKDSSYHPENEGKYLQFFISISKKLKSELPSE
ncbi:hypothetical protein BH10ACI1_BH10ACI1_03090 [soil metagenome]